MIVHGWKVEQLTSGSPPGRYEFANIHRLYHWSSVEYELKRVGQEGLPDWQPHITKVTVERREVTKWEEVDLSDAPGAPTVRRIDE